MPARVGGTGAGCGGAVVGAGAGFGARFFDFALLALFAFFIPFFFRAGAPRFAFLDFFATFNIPTKRCHGGTAGLFLSLPGHTAPRISPSSIIPKIVATGHGSNVRTFHNVFLSDVRFTPNSGH